MFSRPVVLQPAALTEAAGVLIQTAHALPCTSGKAPEVFNWGHLRMRRNFL